MAAWAIERIFDIGGFTVLMVLAIFLPTELRFLPNPEIYPRLRVGGFSAGRSGGRVSGGGFLGGEIRRSRRRVD